jgi:hypothetical protein
MEEKILPEDKVRKRRVKEETRVLLLSITPTRKALETWFKITECPSSQYLVHLIAVQPDMQILLYTFHSQIA